MQIDFTNKNVIVTGSSQGIGKKIAETFAESGAHVVLTDIDQETLEKTKNEFEEEGYACTAQVCNVTNKTEVQKLIKNTYAELGSLDVLVNNAGITKDTLLMRMKDEDWDTVIETNLKGAFLTTRASIRYFLKQRAGSIINISSVVGLTGNAGQSNYSASKAGLIGLSKSVAQELAPRNINVNLVAPGFIKTKMTEKLPEDVKNKYLDNIPLKYFGAPEDVANTVIFLASPLAKYITGQVIKVDGGMVM
ncbi:MAG: 3-oxoacyl-[acyl-carrier-protein] reductase [Candidatus Marinimicrobia bacterium]|nr:3-oxoacyl-[acyl-carrier-protein] reductase [Candidatus Neomarinimicrobiota bacterium]